ncbi:MAG TPA: PPC domain-containing protein [Pyrinomonadaceae bacterium]|nr:PPC domain-containing protein [Pyrinomonadaceae bacterium]
MFPRPAQILSLVALVLLAVMSSARAQMAPATISNITPAGGERSRFVTLTIDGINLGGADRILFSDAHLTGKVVSVEDLGVEKRVIPKGSLSAPIKDVANVFRVVAEVRIAPQTPPGRYTFRLSSALGTTNSMAFGVGALPEIAEEKDHADLAHAQKISLPATLIGGLENVGAQDYYAFRARGGEELIFEVNAASLGSSIDSLVELLDAEGRVVAANDDHRGNTDSLLVYRVPTAGEYFLRIRDTMNSSGKRKFYRLNAGELTYLTGVFPLGVPRGSESEVNVAGFNLDPSARQVKIDARHSGREAERLPVTLNTTKAEPLNRLRVAAGGHPEIFAASSTHDLASAQSVTWPITINGRVGERRRAATDVEGNISFFKFRARQSDRLVLSVAAARLGSPLDSEIEILDAQGKQIPRLVARPLLETFTTLRDHDSLTRGIRLTSPKGIEAGDYLLIGEELIRVERLPENPDMETTMIGAKNQRLTYGGTTAEMHALDSPVYKVALYEPHAELPAGGMTPRVFTYRNDDGGPYYGKDSYLMFTAPADGDYFVKLRDTRDLGGPDYAYRLTIAPPAPDFTLSVTPASPNVPLGGSVPVQVFANRVDDFDAPIEVRVEGLPAGLIASTGVIQPNSYATVLTISCAPDFKAPAGGANFKWRVVGHAPAAGKTLARVADSEDGVSVVSISRPPDVAVTTAQREITIEPGGEVEVTVNVARAGDFAGRVPVEVMNLPLGLNVPDVGLNGVLVRESESTRTFKIVADSKAQPVEQFIIVAARVETNSSVPSVHAAPPIKLRVVPKRSLASSAQKP